MRDADTVLNVGNRVSNEDRPEAGEAADDEDKNKGEEDGDENSVGLDSRGSQTPHRRGHGLASARAEVSRDSASHARSPHGEPRAEIRDELNLEL